MKWYGVLAVCLVCSLGMSCQENRHESRGDGNVDVELVNSLNRIGVDRAIIAQHTLYPYHFMADSAVLNELGARDLSILAGHFAEHEGTLNVRRGDTAPELYEARVTHVLEELGKAGVDTGRMSIADGMPGGSGMPSEHVVTILKSPSGLGSAQGTSYGGMTTR